MRRFAILFTVLFAMLWQSVALGRVGSAVNGLADLGHATLHWQDKSHHHHEDGSLHLDDSNASVQHLLCDHVSATAVVVATVVHTFATLASDAPGGLRQVAVPAPTLDGLFRPPRHRA